MIYNILLHFNVVSNQFLDDNSLNEIDNKYPELKSNNIKASTIVYNLDEIQQNKEDTYKLLLEAYNRPVYFESIFRFIRNSLYEFSYTWYGKMIFPNKIFNKNEVVYLKDQNFSKSKIKIFNTPLSSIPNSYTSYKNIYNFIKNLLMNDGEILKINDWDGLIKETQDSIINKLNSNTSSWFKISNNLRLKYDNKINTSLITTDIFNNIKTNITDLVFHSLVSRGILNEFKPKRSIDEIRSSFDGYYYLTQSKYNKLPNYFRSEKDLEATSFTINVINTISKKQLFALNWLQQIHFFKHFFHQRIMFITGGTGTGKSTQVPKLLLYGLQLLGNYSGKVVNTQPRINATKGNAERISDELGVPIKIYNPIKNKKELSSFFNVQYKTGDSSENATHDLKNTENSKSLSSYLQIVTDGTLLETVKLSPYLKTSYLLNNKLFETSTNAYDIISIDEAHEHNTNMDLLLTFLRDTIQLNNSLRLVIITATIDADEPTYRRYYKYINDNLLYPLNNTLYNNRLSYHNPQLLENIRNTLGFNNTYESLFDRISVDRRLHIAPPLGSTNYIIDEIYTAQPVLKYEDGELLAIQKAIELTKTASGDILLFSITETAINKIVTTLNNNPSIGSSWIAIPYYRTVNSEWKTIVEKINEYISSITIDKKDILLATSSSKEDNDNIRTVKKNTYQHAIIVTTNIAEASITIDSLKYVIDTGYVNTVSFDPILEITTNKPEYITETARIQRKGRVGRVGPGTVYYMYQKDARKYSKINYQITQGINTLVNKLVEYVKEDEESLLLPDNAQKTYEKLELNILEQYQYKIDNIFTDIFYGNPYLRNNLQTIFETVFSYKFKTGYDYPTIIDKEGLFYIIHPLENMFKRDQLTGKFLDSDYKKIRYFEKYINNLFKLRLLVIDNKTLIKTKIFDIFRELTNEIKNVIPINEINYNNLWAMVLGTRYNKFDEVLWSNIIIANSSIEKLSRKYSSKSGKEFSDNKILIKTFGDINSDFNVYTNILNKLKLVIPKLEIYESSEIEDAYNNSKFSLNDMNCIKNYEIRNKNKINLLRIYKNTDNFDKARIELWCDQYGLDYNEINKILNIYLSNHKIVHILKLFVEKYKNYIPYFDTIGNNLEFIYISSYANIALANLDDREDYKIAVKDPFSIVKGNKIEGILKEIQELKSIVTIKHLISFNEKLHIPAIIPALIFPLENNLFVWKDKYMFYKNISPDMIEKYLLPDTEKNKKNKIYNTQLLHLFRLLRTKL